MMTLFDKEYVLSTYINDVAKEGSILTTIKMCKEFGVSLADAIKRISNEFNLSEGEAEAKVKACWEQ